jgi:hypothetical protein
VLEEHFDSLIAGTDVVRCGNAAQVHRLIGQPD